MKSIILLCLTTLFSFSIFSQKNVDEIIKTNEKYRAELNAKYKDPSHSPLKKEAREKFVGFPFYEVDADYYVIASFKKVENSKVFGMKTSSTRMPKYKVYGIVTFTIRDTVYNLNVYQNIGLVKNPAYSDYLFLPFNDYTNGNETYGGGRYLDLRIPEGNTIVLDFNKAYNPYCAYTYGYSCPVPPKENGLKTKIEAGIKFKEKEK